MNVFRLLQVSVIALTVVGVNALSAANYEIDGSHSDVSFRVSHLMVSKTRGSFGDVQGTVFWDAENLDQSKIKGVIQVSSIDTQNRKRDDHLLGPDFFEAEEYPTIVFESTRIEKRGPLIYVTGHLTIHGVTREVEFPVTTIGPIKDPWGNSRLGFEGKLEIDRRDYGLTYNKSLETGGILIGNSVEIGLNIEVVKKEEAKKEEAKKAEPKKAEPKKVRS